MSAADWCQYNIEFRDRATAAHIAAHELLPALISAQDAGLLHEWWFVRKRPWKLRHRRHGGRPCPLIADLLDKLAGDERIEGWAAGTYEPETRAFGGQEAMNVAHTLFHLDSYHLLTRAAQPGVPALGQRESTAVLCSAMLRAAGLDFYEQGDVWGKVGALRPAPDTLSREEAARLAAAMRRLMTANPRALCDPARDGPLAGYDGWITAFEQAGQALADLARRGRLRRGLRAVLAHHIIFHSNRAGLPNDHQSALATLAAGVVFGLDSDDEDGHRGSNTHPRPTTKVTQMTTVSNEASGLSADELRNALTDQLRDRNVLRTPAIEAAFRQTPRHVFLPGVPLDAAYANTPVYTKHNASGESISAASQPGLVGDMLEQLAPQSGQRILEIGAATGYNAAILAAIVGEHGHVTTIDVDEDLVAGAREHLTAADVHSVEVILGDGALGHAASAPYDRIIATVGAYEVPSNWLDQLSPDGRLVVPLRLRGTSTRSITFERNDHGWHSIASSLCVFMPLRGIADDARRYVPLTADGDVVLQVHKDQQVDGHALDGVVNHERHERWSGVIFPPEVSYEWMDLWLCLRLDNPLMRMNVKPASVERGQATPMFGWGSMATVQGKALAYLTVRPSEPAPDGGERYEVGVIGHGPASQDLADRVAEELRIWDEEFRARMVRFELPNTPATANPAHGRFVLDRPNHPITVIWE